MYTRLGSTGNEPTWVLFSFLALSRWHMVALPRNGCIQPTTASLVPTNTSVNRQTQQAHAVNRIQPRHAEADTTAGMTLTSVKMRALRIPICTLGQTPGHTTLARGPNNTRTTTGSCTVNAGASLVGVTASVNTRTSTLPSSFQKAPG